MIRTHEEVTELSLHHIITENETYYEHEKSYKILKKIKIKNVILYAI